jgi:hypothetical protein
MIEKDRDLMKKYLRCVEKGGLAAANIGVARRIKKQFGLTSTGRRNIAPESTLISGYTIFEFPPEKAPPEGFHHRLVRYGLLAVHGEHEIRIGILFALDTPDVKFLNGAFIKEPPL